jgi:hypothetical protein
MKRDDKAIAKTAKAHYKETAVQSNKLFNSFKLLYLYMLKHSERNKDFSMERENFLQLKPELQRLVDMNIIRFKNAHKRKKRHHHEEEQDQSLIEHDLDHYPIHTDYELKSFFKSCGVHMNDEETAFMSRLISDRSLDHITNRQLYEIWASIMHFRNKKSDEILNAVFKEYFLENYEYDDQQPIKDVVLSRERLVDFFSKYNDFFTQEQVDFALLEIRVLEKEFTVREFSLVLLMPRRYHPN